MYNPVFRFPISVFSNLEKIRLNSGWLFSDLESYLNQIINSPTPVILIVHGMPGVGKSFLSSVISERILQCQIIDFDFICSSGNVVSLKHKISQVNAALYSQIEYLIQFGCNIILSTSNPEEPVLGNRNINMSGYKIVIIEFDLIDEETSHKLTRHNLDVLSLKQMKNRWKMIINE